MNQSYAKTYLRSSDLEEQQKEAAKICCNAGCCKTEDRKEPEIIYLGNTLSPHYISHTLKRMEGILHLRRWVFSRLWQQALIRRLI